jgi:SpoVK/Ycf46/Vps4 family AAA+-type ATPase
MPNRSLDDLAQRIEPVAVWDNLVLPKPQLRILRAIAGYFQKSNKLGQARRIAAKGSRRLGTSVLFTGSSSTGKTMAAEVLATELGLDLYRIDLSQVVSQYIGETEKNLSRVFDAAEDTSALLFFDEADALFGKRSEVKDSHDRYANIEASHLFQRIEAGRSLVVLSTATKRNLQSAWLRRIRFAVHFP